MFLSLGRAATAQESELPEFEPISPWFIAALGDPDARSGDAAQEWGIWTYDPGRQGVWLSLYPVVKATGGFTPAGWQHDPNDWWLDENGLLMPKPEFPLPAGQYLVTGEREVTTMLTVHPADVNGNKRWELHDKGATLFDVTHMPCRSARYSPGEGAQCEPSSADRSKFKVAPGAEMPTVPGCAKQDYAVLIVVGLPK